MGKYIKEFNTHSAYNTYINGQDALLPNVSYCVDNDEHHYNPRPYDYSKDYLTIEATEDNVVIHFYSAYKPFIISFSDDGGDTWTQTERNGGDFATLNTGDKLLLKGTNNSYYDGEEYAGIRSTGAHIIYGNILSMIYGDDFRNYTELPANYNANFSKFFKQNTGLTSAENLILPTNTTTYCYANMFYKCSNLTKAPVLPATILSLGCYGTMFSETALTTAPSLPAETMAEQCYRYMFKSCTSLTAAPALPATTLANSCYYYMFGSCTNLTTAPALPATTLATSCYVSMFRDCTGLTSAPELPATTLVSGCYAEMFKDCTSLNYIKAMFTTTPSSSYTSNWVSGVAASGTFVKNSAASWDVSGTSGIPSGWTVQTVSE